MCTLPTDKHKCQQLSKIFAQLQILFLIYDFKTFHFIHYVNNLQDSAQIIFFYFDFMCSKNGIPFKA